MPRKPKMSPALIALHDQRDKEVEAWDRWYKRLTRAFNAVDKINRRIKRLDKRITKAEADQRASG